MKYETITLKDVKEAIEYTENEALWCSKTNLKTKETFLKLAKWWVAEQEKK